LASSSKHLEVFDSRAELLRVFSVPAGHSIIQLGGLALYRAEISSCCSCMVVRWPLEACIFYLDLYTQVKDELVAVGEIISEVELGRIALKGFTKEWDVFVKCVVGRENFPDWSRLWDDFTQEEIQDGVS
jgi:hypothetical protein